jgi:hypothetical protein
VRRIFSPNEALTTETTMSTSSFRLTAVACALSWLLVGMHAPIVHQITEHGRIPSAPVLIAVVLVLAIAVATLGALLRAAPRPGGGTPAM